MQYCRNIIAIMFVNRVWVKHVLFKLYCLFVGISEIIDLMTKIVRCRNLFCNV